MVPAVQDIFKMASITTMQFVIAAAVSMVSVLWFEVYKMNLPKQIYELGIRN
jgi:hypothetical protein